MTPRAGPPTLRERIRRALRPPRRLRFSRSGWFFTGGSVLVGFAAIGTGNNLLFLMLGAMLGFIVLSGWLSEQTLRRLEVRRRVGRARAGEPARLVYELRNGNRRLPACAVAAGEEGWPSRGWVAQIEPGATAAVRTERRFERRGAYPLDAVTLSTSFPFGLFVKERDVVLPGELVVWPRGDRAVREPRPPGERALRRGVAGVGAAGARGEYRGLRPYRPGDDPRDVHWRTTARMGHPMVREYDRDRSRALWLCLDLRAREGDEAEAAVEVAASLAGGALLRGDAVGLATQDARATPAAGTLQGERILDLLARARFRGDAPRLHPPAAAGECVLVTPGTAAGPWGDVYSTSGAPR
jgi:uncharacterized protein (DUF58 family)